MAREPADRYATARELAEDLRRFATGQIVRAHEYSRRERARRFIRRVGLRAWTSYVEAAMLTWLDEGAPERDELVEVDSRTGVERWRVPLLSNPRKVEVVLAHHATPSCRSSRGSTRSESKCSSAMARAVRACRG